MRWLLGMTIALMAPVGTAGAASTFTIRTSPDAVTRIGTFQPRRDATVGAAVRAFGVLRGWVGAAGE